MLTLYKRCFAQVLDLNQQFLKAAIHYYDISQTGPDEERRQALLQAVNCAILAEAGPNRSRLLATLFKDERTLSLPHFNILQKMYLERVLKQEEVAKFAASLQPHQKAMLPDGLTVLERAVIEHNLLSASRLYNNIRIDELGLLLGVGGDKAEQVAARMIAQERLRGSIDQTDRLISFDTEGSELTAWDSQIEQCCHLVNNVLDRIAHKYPEFARVY
eukprot:TRINITY_DN4242_c0_g1_i6.p1 TRINITY_DN4242_c0_g1~~TRINITY_DN4242_c0_g1_i6.p1  ORF type:complete len:217 (-),score=69.68 TRINITY_DN4242_c0_g1_i6:279-929(-)